ncbi:GmrSD restriction endonuclease domain-containing protein [Leptospira kanakyensis]|uniref:DUF262 domain-containing protein n=1 Tax=Leptospira kanakyensis TaxID=2484968 RepID=A0A6N4QCC8_9LEPT|nr:DUF262 domain-containing protein [Leptospira kanakyensis]TGK45967.1 DUF262 domain-containing protein [Leptospira kanakyensis]TGK70607.1 DUF262 domain-containing protein [Leptospira kanakyensis]
MTNYLKRDSNSISIANLYENYRSNKYNLKPSYQRESVWSEEKKSFLIDSIVRNFPIPPIFLRQKIDDSTGTTSYDVIDGKQRLISIFSFINDEIPISSEEEPFDSEYEKEIAGCFFSELDQNEIRQNAKKYFWRYQLSIEYIDSDSEKLIKNIFDRLNRNGEPLTGQELRNARYNTSEFLKVIKEIYLRSIWQEILSKIDIIRMENYEFISEIFFEIEEGSPIQANQEELDKKYEMMSLKPLKELNKILELFNDTEYFLSKLEVIEECKIGVSHTYGIWSFCHFCVVNSIPPEKVKNKIKEFYRLYKSKNYSIQALASYRKTMSSNTKSKFQRANRLTALRQFCLD